MRRFWMVIWIVLCSACSNEPESQPVDREALKAELRAEILAEMRTLIPASSSSEASEKQSEPSVPGPTVVVDEPVDDAEMVPSVEPAVEPKRPMHSTTPSVPKDPVRVVSPSDAVKPPAAEKNPSIVPIAEVAVPEDVAPHASLAVVRLDVATGVNRERREPENIGKTFSLADTSMLYAYMAVQNKGNPAQVSVEWYRAGTRRSHITLNVGHSIRGWRTWSKVRLGAKDSGPWEVHVLDTKGHLLHRSAFEVTP